MRACGFHTRGGREDGLRTNDAIDVVTARTHTLVLPATTPYDNSALQNAELVCNAIVTARHCVEPLQSPGHQHLVPATGQVPGL